MLEGTKKFRKKWKFQKATENLESNQKFLTKQITYYNHNTNYHKVRTVDNYLQLPFSNVI